MLELLSYGEYDQLFISVICFLKRSRLPFHRFQFFIYFLSFRKTSTYIIFLLLNNNDHSDSVLKRWIIYTWINFSLGYPCCEINFWRTKNLKIGEASVQKFLRIIWIKLFVIWQVLKPPLRKLSLGRFFQFHKMAKSLWDRLPYFYKQFLKTRKSGLFQMPALFVHKNDFA